MRLSSWNIVAIWLLVSAGCALAQGLTPPDVTDRTTELPERYQHWLDEDVRYIISDQERTQFLLYRSDLDRDEFVISFWARRNPNPGSSENPFKEEHYRRMAYANEHFAGTLPGWQTDRGQIYIVWGPPDEALVSQDGAFPAQVWRYRATTQRDHREFRFVDRCRSGEYELEQ